MPLNLQANSFDAGDDSTIEPRVQWSLSQLARKLAQFAGQRRTTASDHEPEASGSAAWLGP
jgi:hypothetical protein